MSIKLHIWFLVTGCLATHKVKFVHMYISKRFVRITTIYIYIYIYIKVCTHNYNIYIYIYIYQNDLYAKLNYIYQNGPYTKLQSLSLYIYIYIYIKTVRIHNYNIYIYIYIKTVNMQNYNIYITVDKENYNMYVKTIRTFILLSTQTPHAISSYRVFNN